MLDGENAPPPTRGLPYPDALVRNGLNPADILADPRRRALWEELVKMALEGNAMLAVAAEMVQLIAAGVWQLPADEETASQVVLTVLLRAAIAQRCAVQPQQVDGVQQQQPVACDTGPGAGNSESTDPAHGVQ